MNMNIQGHKPDQQTVTEAVTDEGMWECKNVYSSSYLIQDLGY